MTTCLGVELVVRFGFHIRKSVGECCEAARP